MMNHYHNNYYDVGLVGYAHGVISIFFVLSGYGNFHSLNNSGTSLWNTSVSFLIKRLVRIYSLYWVYLFICIVSGKKLTVLKIFAIDSSGAWFVPAIMICYFVAIPLFEILKRVHAFLYVALVVTGSALGHYLLSILDVGVPWHVSEYVVRYCGVYFGYVGLFALGLSIPKLLEHLEGLPIAFPRSALILSGTVFLAMIHYSRTSVFLYGFLLILSANILVVVLLKDKPQLPLKKLVAALGKHSYSLYLFHLFYYAFLQRIGIIHQYSAISIVMTMLLFPLFYYCCCLVDKGVNTLILHVSSPLP